MLKEDLNSVETSNNKSYPNSFSSTVLIGKSPSHHFFKNQKLIITRGTCLFITVESSLFSLQWSRLFL